MKMVSVQKASPKCLPPRAEIPDWPYGDDCYNFNYAKRGVALIFAMKNFKPPMKKRKEASHDSKKMVKIFKNFGFHVKQYKDLTTDQMRQKLKKAQRFDYRKADCFVCMISTHGKEMIRTDKKGKYCEHYLSTTDGSIGTTEVIQYFHEDFCQSLKDKPKLFFIQACRIRHGMMPTDSGQIIKLGGSQNTNRKDANTTGSDTVDSICDSSELESRCSGVEKFARTNIPVSDEILEDWEELWDDECSCSSESDVSDNEDYEESDCVDSSGFLEPPDRFQHAMQPIRCFKDMLIMLSAPSGYYGYRRKGKTGSWLIHNLYEVLGMYKSLGKKDPRQWQILSSETTRETLDLLSLLLDVTRKIAMEMQTCIESNPDMHEKKTVPQIIHMLTRDVFFPLIKVK